MKYLDSYVSYSKLHRVQGWYKNFIKQVEKSTLLILLSMSFSFTPFINTPVSNKVLKRHVKLSRDFFRNDNKNLKKSI